MNTNQIKIKNDKRLLLVSQNEKYERDSHEIFPIHKPDATDVDIKSGLLVDKERKKETKGLYPHLN